MTYQEYMNHFEQKYGDEGIYAFEACALSQKELDGMSISEVETRVIHALQDMGQP